jgi:hypothetical protein
MTPRPARSLHHLLVIALAPIVAGGAASVGLGGCVSSPSSSATPASSDTGSDPADELNSCTSPRKYFATLGDGEACVAVPAAGGHWLPKPLFSDAPPEIAAETCTYVWSAPAGTPPDPAALRAALAWSDGLAEACGASAKVDVGVIEPIVGIDAGHGIGAAGCDVCGRVRNGRIWVVLPSDRVAVRQLSVRLDNGTAKVFQIAPTSARALSIPLPAPPAGAAYVDGRVTVF